MVHGLCTHLEFPYAQFSCVDVSGGLLFGPFWKAVYRLDRNGLKALAITADVVSTNRCLNKLHSNKVYKKVNHYCRDRRYMLYLHFFADPPHLWKLCRGKPKATSLGKWVFAFTLALTQLKSRNVALHNRFKSTFCNPIVQSLPTLVLQTVEYTKWCLA